MWRFHDHVTWAIEEILAAAWEIAMGVLYSDEDPHVYVRPPNGKMIRFLLEWRFPEKYGKHPKIDIPQKVA